MTKYPKDSPMGMTFKFEKLGSGGYVMLREPGSKCPKDLKTVTIPDDVVEIGDGCFRGLTGVEHVIIPNSVRKIGNNCFANCQKLSSITIPDSVREIGNNCFLDCPKLSSITIPDSVTSIGESCFSRCISLHSVDIGSGLKVLPKESFYCTNLYRLSVPSNVKEVHDSCFAFCRNLSYIEFAGIEDVSDDAFESCIHLRTIGFNEGVVHIGNLSRVDSRYFSSLYVPDSVRSFYWDLKFLDILSVPSRLGSIARYLKGTDVKVIVR